MHQLNLPVLDRPQAAPLRPFLPAIDERELLDDVFATAYRFFTDDLTHADGLVRDARRSVSPSSIAAIGFAMTAHAAAVATGRADRMTAAGRVAQSLRRLRELPQGPQRDAAGYRGFFYHFLKVPSGQREWKCELSSIDTALLMAGALCAASFFDADDTVEQQIRTDANALYEAVDWPFLLRDDGLLRHGWRPEKGFIPHVWSGCDESAILYLLAIGSPTHPIPAEAWWRRCERMGAVVPFGLEELRHVPCGPLFTHQFSHAWIDFRGLMDDASRELGLDFFENSRRATLAQRKYARLNPQGFVGYDQNTWGLSASNGPGPRRRSVNGRRVTFHSYVARGIPLEGRWPDDGTLLPAAVAGSLPFCPDEVLAGLASHRAISRRLDPTGDWLAAHNQSFSTSDAPHGWLDDRILGIDHGPAAIMVANYDSEAIWSVMKRCRPLTNALTRCEFRGGWLE